MSSSEDARVFLVLMAARKVGNYLYYWGGEAAVEGGFDCSGFVCTALQETARAWPELYDGGRARACDLYSYFHERGCPDIREVDELRPGCLVFYRKESGEIVHVAIHVSTVPPIKLKGGVRETGPLAFEAGGSGSAAKSPRSALRTSAGVRLSASDYSGGRTWVANDPFVLLGGP